MTLKLDPAFEPIPDLIAVEGVLEEPYPTKPFEVVIEILSPLDPYSRVLRKCDLYESWGIRQIVIVDPNDRLIWRYENDTPHKTDIIARRGERVITAQELWAEVDRRRPAQG